MSRKHESGGVSLFVVIFTAILITVITVGFTRFVIGYQQQTQRNDLSTRAYNSALAGVEDAKRVLVAYTKECADSPSSPSCTQLKNAIASGACDTVVRAGITRGSDTDASGNKEQQVGDPADNQAYTCVKILLDTDYVPGTVTKDGSTVVHLKGVSSFDRIKITWFTKKDSKGTDDNVQLYDVNPLALPPAIDWPTSAPPILRAQYIPSSVNTADLDDEARTVFLYPSPSLGVPNSQTVKLKDDARRASDARVLSPYPAGCDATYTSVAGACSRILEIPSDQGPVSDAYLQLSARYNSTSFRIELFNGSTLVKFDGVSPQVDSTGRAAELFRRVSANVEIGGVSLPAPVAALFTTGNLCKDFTLGDSDNPYNPGNCNP